MNNIKNLFFIALTAIFTSCSQTYTFTQVFTLTPVATECSSKVTNEAVIFEDENCIITYNFWSKGGNASYSFYNKSNQMITIDMTKSFFVKNGNAYAYFQNRTFSEEKSVFQSSSSTYYSSYFSADAIINTNFSNSYYGIAVDGTSNTRATANSTTESTTLKRTTGSERKSGTTIKEKEFVSIPPEAGITFNGYGINNLRFVACDFEIYPSESASKEFTPKNTPTCFRNVITYKLENDEKYKTINNELYVSKITNYAEPQLYDFVKKEEENCINITGKNIHSAAYQYTTLYDRHNKVASANKFYLPYSTISNKRLYKHKIRYRYNALANGYYIYR